MKLLLHFRCHKFLERLCVGLATLSINCSPQLRSGIYTVESEQSTDCVEQDDGWEGLWPLLDEIIVLEETPGLYKLRLGESEAWGEFWMWCFVESTMAINCTEYAIEGEYFGDTTIPEDITYDYYYRLSGTSYSNTAFSAMMTFQAQYWMSGECDTDPDCFPESCSTYWSLHAKHTRSVEDSR